LGEIFIEVHKEGAGFRAMMEQFLHRPCPWPANTVSPPQEFPLTHSPFTKFEPAANGPGKRQHQERSTLFFDYIFREAGPCPI